MIDTCPRCLDNLNSVGYILMLAARKRISLSLMKNKLNHTLKFGIEPYENRVRLIEFEADKELVCRKEKTSELNRFL